MTEKWVRELAKRVVEILGEKHDDVRKALDGSQYFQALAAAARELHIDIMRDKARFRFTCDNVRREAKRILRTKGGGETVKPYHPSTVSHIELTLPPGDRE